MYDSRDCLPSLHDMIYYRLTAVRVYLIDAKKRSIETEDGF